MSFVHIFGDIIAPTCNSHLPFLAPFAFPRLPTQVFDTSSVQRITVITFDRCPHCGYQPSPVTVSAYNCSASVVANRLVCKSHTLESSLESLNARVRVESESSPSRVRVESESSSSLSRVRVESEFESSLESPVEMSSRKSSQYTMSIPSCSRHVGTAVAYISRWRWYSQLIITLHLIVRHWTRKL